MLYLDEEKDKTFYFNYIDRMVSKIERWKEVSSMLELAVWKAKLSEQRDQSGDIIGATIRVQCRIACDAVVIIPNVMPFVGWSDYLFF